MPCKKSTERSSLTGVNNFDEEENKFKFHRLSNKLHSSLAPFEISFLATFKIFAVLYAVVYCTFVASRNYHVKLSRYYLEPGWFGNGLFQYDIGDSEWVVFSAVLLKNIPWFLLQLIGSHWLRRINKKILPLFNISLSFIQITWLLGAIPTMFLASQALAMFLVLVIFPSSVVVWICALLLLLVAPEYIIWIINLNNKVQSSSHQYIFHVTWAWINLRCISFCLDMLWGHAKRSTMLQAFLDLLYYCFYMPVCISGPHINYTDFYEGVYSDYIPWTNDRLKSFGKRVVKYSFWIVIMFVIKHIWYVSAISSESRIVSKLDLWTVSGIGMAVLLLFQLKYVIFYGMACTFAIADGITNAPPQPKCILVMHLNSKIWRSFDVGLYRFLQKYIYRPSCGTSPSILMKMVGGTVTFTFIYLWHGTSEHIMYWAFYNYCTVTIESMVRMLGGTPTYQTLEKSLLSPGGIRRLHGFLSIPTCVGSYLSNLYFMLGVRTGNLIASRIIMSPPLGAALILFFFYCCCQVGFQTENIEIKQELRKLKVA